LDQEDRARRAAESQMSISREDPTVALVPLANVSDNEIVDDLTPPYEAAHVEPGKLRDQQGPRENCPYCGRAMVEWSEDHIFPQFMGGTRTIACCKPCNDRFGHRFEGKAAQWFQKLHFYFATQRLHLKVPQIRWKEALEQAGRRYDGVFENGEAKFTLSRPIVSIDNGVMNAQFGSQGQLKPVLSSLRKKHGISPTPDLEITPTIMPKTEIRMGPELPRLAIKMCSALGSLLPAFTSDELHSSSKETRRLVGNVTYDFRSHFPGNESRPALSHLIYVERGAAGLQGIVRFFGAHQYFCQIGPPRDQRPSCALLAVLDPVEGAESFYALPRLNLSQPPSEMAESAVAAATSAWATQLSQSARQRGASESFEVTLRTRVPDEGEG
jgi:hypothetical protein